ncbi:MAG: sensor histidine kinase [Pseudobdellovibrionaceae bacterium]
MAIYALVAIGFPQFLNFTSGLNSGIQLPFEGTGGIIPYLVSRTRFYKASIWLFIFFAGLINLRAIYTSPDPEVIAGYLVYFIVILLMVSLVLNYGSLIGVSFYFGTCFLVIQLLIPDPHLPFFNSQFFAFVWSAITVIIGAWARNRLSQQLQFEKARNINLSQMSSMGEMAGGVAHEINNPLAIISIASERLKKILPPSEGPGEALEKQFAVIQKNVDRISLLTRGLLIFSKDGSKDPIETLKIKEILDNTLRLCAEKFHSHGVELLVSDFDSSLTCRGRRVQLCQALMNVLNNAFEAVEKSQDKKINLTILELEDMVRIRIADSGSGIPAQLRTKIFQPFFTTKVVGSGLGLGLSVAQSLMEDQGGSLRLRRTADPTVFDLKIPRSRPIPKISLPEKVKSQPPPLFQTELDWK